MEAYGIITYRVISIMALFLVATLLTGRRHMGELPIFDFLVIITLGSVVGADIAEPEIKHLPTAYALILIMLLQYLHGLLLINSRKLGKLLTFEPVVVIEQGQFVKGNLKKLRYSIDTVLTMLREKDIFDIGQVEFAIIESTGQLSVLKKVQYQPPTAEAMQLQVPYEGLPVQLIVEGKVYEENLQLMQLNHTWLMAQLAEYNIDQVGDVFYAAVNSSGHLYVSKGLETSQPIHNLRH